MDSEKEKYVLAEEEEEALPIMNLMNIFTTYYNKKNSCKGTLFEGTNPFNKHSINSRMVEFMEEIRTYKLHPETPVADVGEDDIKKYKKLVVETEDKTETLYCKTVMGLLLHLVEYDWTKVHWSITESEK